MKYLIKTFKILIFLGVFFLLGNSAKAELGALSGYAWSENAGWINFNPSGGGVSLDSDTRELKGYAWGENIGWLSFNCLDTSSCADTNYKITVPPSLSMGCRSSSSNCPVCSASDTALPAVSSINITEIASNSATIKWNTDEAADSIVEYGIDTSYKFLTGNPEDISAKTLVHSVGLRNLLSDTAYHFKIISRDAAGNIFISADQVFKTLQLSGSDKFDNPDDLRLILPEEAIVKNLTNSSVSVSWQTDMDANSLVRIKLADAPESAWQEIGDTSSYAKDHHVTLTGLQPGTDYQYQVKSSNSSGSTAISRTKTFKTKPKPIISDVLVSDIKLNSAIVSWKTNIASTTIMDYGNLPEYGFFATGDSNDLVTAHEIKLKNLESGVEYNFRVKGNDGSDSLIISDNYSFKTYSFPLIEKYNVESVKDNFVVIAWVSNADIDSLVIYNNLKTGESRTQGDTKLVRDHNLKLENLESGTEYAIKIEGRDILGNTAKGPEIKIKTLLDTIAPSIANIRTYTNLMSVKDKAQIVVVWKTDEQSTSQVFLYNIANTAEPVYTSAFDSNLTTNHTMVITDLKVNTSYRLRMESADKNGNSGLSQDFAVLTPNEKKSIIVMILESFEKIFEWTSKINL